MAQDNRRFGRGGLYVCRCCGRRTRETGHGEESCELCAPCYELGGLENQHSDECADGHILDCARCGDEARHLIAKGAKL